MKRYLILLAILFVGGQSFGQIIQSPSGPTTINETYTYSYSGFVGSVTWEVSPPQPFLQGFEVDPNTTSIMLNWGSTGSKTVKLKSGPLTIATLNVNVQAEDIPPPLTKSPWTEINNEVYYTGNVGIGNTNPAYKLDVSATSRIKGNLILKSGGILDDDTSIGGNSDDWLKLNGYIELKSNTDNYGIVLRDKDNSEYFGLTQKNGSSYLTDSNTSGNYFLRGNGRTTFFGGKAITTRYGVSGTYNSAQVQGIWSIGKDWAVDLTNNNFGTQYGMVYAHTNAGTSGSKKPISGWGHQIMFTNNGTRNISLSMTSGHAYFAGKVGIGTISPSTKLDVNGTARIRNLGDGSALNRVIVADSNGKLFSRDASSLSGLDLSQPVDFEDDVSVAGSFTVPDGNISSTNGDIVTHVGDIESRNRDVIGRNFYTKSLNNNSVAKPMQVYTERGGISFIADKRAAAGNGFSWRNYNKSLMLLSGDGRLAINYTPVPGRPREALEVGGGTMRIEGVSQEPTSLNKILAVDEHGKVYWKYSGAVLGSVTQEPSNLERVLSVDNNGNVFWKSTETIQGSIDPDQDIDFGGVITIGNPSFQSTPSGTLYVNGDSYFTEINVEAGPWPDYVFEKDYQLKPLQEVKSFIDENGHLPEVPSAKEVDENGINVAEMNAVLLKKVEELTLYQIELLQMLKIQQQELTELRDAIKSSSVK